MNTKIKPGTNLRVWPGRRPGRSGTTRANSVACTLGAEAGVYVDHACDDDGKPMPSGFYAMTHVEVLP